MAVASDNFNRDTGPSTIIRVMSFNIHHGEWPDISELSLSEVRDVISDSGADLIGLQDVDKFRSRSDFVDQTAWLANELGFFYAYGENVVFPGDGYYGNGILSRYPITSSTNILLPSPAVEQRGLLITNIDIYGVPMVFANTHLDHSAGGSVRELQTTEINTILGASPTSTILTGDMNSEPTSTEVQTLTSVYLDTWAEVGVGNGYTFPGNALTKRIDYVMVSDDINIGSGEVLDDVATVDHFPYRADISAFTIPPSVSPLGTSSSGHEWTNV